MKVIYEAPKVFRDVISSYCPGCGHGIIQRIIGECIDEMEIRHRVVGVLGVGCSSTSWKQMNFDMLSAPHGRPGAAASGMKRCNPNKIVFTYQGDGDCGSIGLAETVHAALRGENITVFSVNNTVFAMTGGQMAPTTLEGQVTVTSPQGRDVMETGRPLHMPELLANLPDVRLAARVSLFDAKHIRDTKKVIRKALENQKNEVGYSFVEILSPCPSIWNMSPGACLEHIRTQVVEEFPLRIFKDTGGDEGC